MNKIGDKIWYSSCKRENKQVPCEVCFGNKYVTVIKGNGDKVTVDCRGCETGYLGSVGYQKIVVLKSNVKLATINRIEVTNNGIEYYTDFGCGKDRCFENKEDAIAKAKEIARNHYADDIERIKRKEKPNKDWTWHVYYHQRSMKAAEKEYEYHSSKLDVAREKKAQHPRKPKTIKEQ